MGLFKSRKSKHNQSVTSNAEQSPRQSSSQSQTQQQIYSTHQRNLSTSNLSTTSTLTDEQTKPSRTQPPARMTSYEAFLYHAREDEERREARRKAQEHAWRVAAQRRAQSNMWPEDSWRGGFGPPSRGRDICDGGVEGWLRGNGLRK